MSVVIRLCTEAVLIIIYSGSSIDCSCELIRIISKVNSNYMEDIAAVINCINDNLCQFIESIYYLIPVLDELEIIIQFERLILSYSDNYS